MTPQEKERFFRYMQRRYESFGPIQLKRAVDQVKYKMIADSTIDEASFWELFEDLIQHNKWSPAAVLAYFQTYNIEERI